MSNLFSVENKRVLVTGGSRGIGKMIATGYVKAGAKVYISSRKKQDCDETAKELAKFGACVSIPGDISSIDGISALVQEIVDRESQLEILVNNAGASWGAMFKEYPESGFDKVMDTNVKGIFYLTRELMPLLEKAASPGDPARVINIGSIDGIKVPAMENYAYSASKAAVHHMTKVLAIELAKSNITCNAIAPGPFESKMTKEMMNSFKDLIIARCPLKRIGNPEDMAGIAIFLGSRAASYMNGVIIPVDGGICLT
ncbi:MAG: 3-oxoacyl-ACP reductase [Desulfobacterium sp.]|nr:3-oxoacyl-ACP reductase [Desulfobacterium sp.]